MCADATTISAGGRLDAARMHAREASMRPPGTLSPGENYKEKPGGAQERGLPEQWKMYFSEGTNKFTLAKRRHARARARMTQPRRLERRREAKAQMGRAGCCTG